MGTVVGEALRPITDGTDARHYLPRGDPSEPCTGLPDSQYNMQQAGQKSRWRMAVHGTAISELLQSELEAQCRSLKSFVYSRGKLMKAMVLIENNQVTSPWGQL